MSAKNDSILIRGRVSRSRFRTLGAPLIDGSTDPETSTARAWAAVSCHAQAGAESVATPGPLRQVCVEALCRETADAVTVRFRTLDGEGLDFEPGQHLSCYFNVTGQRLKRPYSFSALPGSGQAQITVKRIDAGVVSAHINQHLAVGDVFEVLPPAGDFLLPTVLPAHCVFIAGGSGITPSICLLEAALQRDDLESATLIYANRSRADIIFAQRLAQLEQQHQRLKIVHVLDQADADWNGETGLLTAAQLMRLVGDRARDTHYYICGPQGLMDLATGALQDAGTETARVHTEVFTAAAVTAQVSTSAQEVYFSTSDRRITVAAGETVLEAALREGVPLEYSCTVGGCGHCKVSVSSGEVVMDTPNCLSEAERARGERLMCVGRPLGPLEVLA